MYAARRLVDGRPVAVKVVRGGSAAVLREVRFAAALRHPGIVRILDHGRVAGELGPDHAGAAWVAMEQADGTLASRVGRVDGPELRQLVAAVLDALAHAHAAGVLHRDLKPANVLVFDGRPVLADFGIARALAEPGGGRVGTPSYAAPEQWSDDGAQGPWTDLYALGRTVLALAGGRGRLLALAPPAIAGWIDAVCASNPAERLQRAADARHLWLAGWGDSGTAVPPPRCWGDGAEVTWEAVEALSLPTGAATGQPPPQAPSGGAARVPPPPMPADWRTPDALAAGSRPAPTGAAILPFAARALVGRDAERDLLWAALGRVHAGGAEAVSIAGPPGVGKTALLDWFCVRAAETGAADVVRVDGRAGLAAAVHARDPGADPVDVGAWLGAWRDDRPLVLAIDDADGDGLVDQLLGPAHLPPGVFVVAARRAGPGLPLGPLDDATHRRLLREVIHLEEGLAADVHARTRGDPGLAAAVLHALADRGALVLGPDGHRLREGATVTIPASAAEVWAERLRSAAEDQRQWLGWAAILGPTGDRDELAAVGAAGGAAGPVTLDGWSTEVPDAPGRFDLPRALCEVVRAAAGPDAARMHRVCADVLHARGADPEQVALHRARAGAWAEALDGLLGAAKVRLQRREPWATLSLVDTARGGLDSIGAPAADRRRLVADLLRARALTRSDRREQAVAALEDVERRAGVQAEPDLARQARSHRAQVLSALGRFAEAEALLGGGSPSDRFVRGIVRMQLGAHDDAFADLTAAAASLSPQSAGRAARVAGVVAVHAGRLDEARLWLDRALDTADEGQLADASLGRAELELARGDIAEARRWVHRSIAHQRRTPRGVGTALTTLGWIELAAADPARAREAFAAALSIGDDRVRADATIGRLAVALAEGSAAETARWADAAEQLPVEAFEWEVARRLHQVAARAAEAASEAVAARVHALAARARR